MSGASKEKRFCIRNVRVLEEDHLGEIRTVYVDDEGLIARPFEGGEVVDGEGGVLLPGLIDAHVHLTQESELRELARCGVTTALDMGAWPAEMINALRHKVGLPDIRSAGLVGTSPGSFHSMIMPIPGHELISGGEDAADWVQRRINEGSDYIKLLCDTPGPPQEVLDAVTAAAHKHEKLVVAHTAKLAPFVMALDAGADILTHVPIDAPIEDGLAERIAAEKRIAVPTLTMMEATSQTPGLLSVLKLLWSPRILFTIIKAIMSAPGGQGARNYDHAKASVTAMYQAGVPILAGTDCHDVPASPFEVKHGESFFRELELLVEAGLSNLDAIRAATELPAKHFQLDDRGVIAEGKRADMVLVGGDPLEDLRNLRKIKRVWCNGVEHE